MLTPKALLPIRRFPIFHHIRPRTGWTVTRLYDHHRRSFLGLDVYDTASPLVCIYQEGLRKSTNLGHYPRYQPLAFVPTVVIMPREGTLRYENGRWRPIRERVVEWLP